MSNFILKQLPVIPPDSYIHVDRAFIVPRVLELTYTARVIKAFAEDVLSDANNSMKSFLRQQWEADKAAIGRHEWKPSEWTKIEQDGIPLLPLIKDENRRAALRRELDVLYARLDGLARNELRYVLDPSDVYRPEFPGETFRVLMVMVIKKFGENRTRRLVLEAGDRLGKVGE